jgi:hypothetical protein
MITIVYEDTTYPIAIQREKVVAFLHKQDIPDENIDQLTIRVKRHPEYFWNTLFIPDGLHYAHNNTVIIYTNWIEEDIRWDIFQDHHDSLPYRINVILFSLARIFSKEYRQPVDLSQVRRKLQREVLTDLNKVLLHELWHFIDDKVLHNIPIEGFIEPMAEDFEKQHQSLRLIEWETRRE